MNKWMIWGKHPYFWKYPITKQKDANAGCGGKSRYPLHAPIAFPCQNLSSFASFAAKKREICSCNMCIIHGTVVSFHLVVLEVVFCFDESSRSSQSQQSSPLRIISHPIHLGLQNNSPEKYPSSLSRDSHMNHLRMIIFVLFFLMG